MPKTRRGPDDDIIHMGGGRRNKRTREIPEDL
jgi:hypothetical protein